MSRLLPAWAVSLGLCRARECSWLRRPAWIVLGKVGLGMLAGGLGVTCSVARWMAEDALWWLLLAKVLP